MRHSSAGCHGRGDLRPAQPAAQYLHIGNTRWHWSAEDHAGPIFWHSAAGAWPSSLDPGDLLAWAAVGHPPLHPHLPEPSRVCTEDVPLGGFPPWVGVDRALGTSEAWLRQGGGPVLLVDAGSALTFTRVRADGGFAGGRILAGLRMQLEALARQTRGLPKLRLDRWYADAGSPSHGWPTRTDQAMVEGVLRGLAAAIIEAHEAAVGEEPGCGLWLTGGDAALMRPLLAGGAELDDEDDKSGRIWAPDLVMQGLMRLRPCLGQEKRAS